MRFYWLILGTLAVWRATHLFAAEDGPWAIFARLRRLAGSGFWGGLLDCFYCLSLWFALPPAYYIGSTWPERILLWPALSGAAILLERITSREAEAPLAAYHYETQEESHVLREQDHAPERRLSAGN